MSLLALFADRVITPAGMVEVGVVLVEDAAIRAAGPRSDIRVPANAVRHELGDHTLAPGFIDIHIHGGAGHDVMEATADSLHVIGRHLLRHGTTSYFPTTVSAPLDRLERSLAGLNTVLSNRAFAGSKPVAEPLGIHLEGPFISTACRGAHGKADLQPPSIELFNKLHGAAGPWLKIMTLAPELPGARELQAHAQAAGVKIGIGHSDASYERARAAIDAGATHGVHVFNAMRGFSHREPGILGAVLTDDRVMAEVIADGVHVSPPALQLLLRVKGVGRTVLITDAVSATGMKPGRHALGAMEIQVGPDPATGRLACRNAEGALAGSVLTQEAAVAHIMEFTGADLADAIRMAGANAAQLLGLSETKGNLQTGADADIAILTPNGTVAGVVSQGAMELF